MKKPSPIGDEFGRSSMNPKEWMEIAGGSFVTLGGLMFFGFWLAFTPGWANGWPLGLSIHHVWPAGMSVLLFLLLMMAAATVGAVVGAVCSRWGVGLRRGRAIYAGWLVGSGVVALVASFWAFRVNHAAALEMWPNGYNP